MNKENLIKELTTAIEATKDAYFHTQRAFLEAKSSGDKDLIEKMMNMRANILIAQGIARETLLKHHYGNL